MFLSEEFLINEYITKKKTQRQIGIDLGITQTNVSYWIRKYGIPAQSHGGGGFKFEDLAGQRFGRLLVIELYIKSGQSQNRKTLWECLCDCGKITNVWTNSLKNGATKSCGCLKSDLSYKGFKEISKSYWNHIINGSKSRNLSLNVTIEQAWDLYESQNRKCALTGVDLVFSRNYTKDYKLQTASFDRIENSIGYEIANVQWTHKDVNILRSNFSVGEFIYWCEKVSSWNKT